MGVVFRGILCDNGRLMQDLLFALGDVCDHAAAKLYDRSPDRAGLVDIATIVQLAGSRLRRDLPRHRAAVGNTRRLQAVDLALAAIHRRLFWLQHDGAHAPDDVLRHDLDSCLRLVVKALSVVNASHSAAAP
jgi:hypothetical protein